MNEVLKPADVFVEVPQLQTTGGIFGENAALLRATVTSLQQNSAQVLGAVLATSVSVRHTVSSSSWSTPFFVSRAGTHGLLHPQLQTIVCDGFGTFKANGTLVLPGHRQSQQWVRQVAEANKIRGYGFATLLAVRGKSRKLDGALFKLLVDSSLTTLVELKGENYSGEKQRPWWWVSSADLVAFVSAKPTSPWNAVLRERCPTLINVLGVVNQLAQLLPKSPFQALDALLESHLPAASKKIVVQLEIFHVLSMGLLENITSNRKHTSKLLLLLKVVVEGFRNIRFPIRSDAASMCWKLAMRLIEIATSTEHLDQQMGNEILRAIYIIVRRCGVAGDATTTDIVTAALSLFCSLSHRMESVHLTEPWDALTLQHMCFASVRALNFNEVLDAHCSFARHANHDNPVALHQRLGAFTAVLVHCNTPKSTSFLTEFSKSIVDHLKVQPSQLLWLVTISSHFAADTPCDRSTLMRLVCYMVDTQRNHSNSQPPLSVSSMTSPEREELTTDLLGRTGFEKMRERAGVIQASRLHAMTGIPSVHCQPLEVLVHEQLYKNGSGKRRKWIDRSYQFAEMTLGDVVRSRVSMGSATPAQAARLLTSLRLELHRTAYIGDVVEARLRAEMISLDVHETFQAVWNARVNAKAITYSHVVAMNELLFHEVLSSLLLN